ncbi:MAG: thioesterase family protein [Nakamurella sp.]
MTSSERPPALRTITTHRRLEWRDTDASGHQHHSVIIRWVEQAEAELFESLGSIELFDRIPRVKYEAEYHSRLWFRDEVEIQLNVAAIGRTSMTYEFEITGPHGIAATGRVVIVHTAPEAGRATPWPEKFKSALVTAESASNNG